jgi:uncharacterized protein YjdB
MPFKFKLSRRLARLRKIALLTPVLPLACVSGDKLVVDPQPPNADIVRLVISPSETTVQSGQSVDFTAVGLTATGDTTPIAVTWFAKKGTVTEGGSDKPGKRLGHYKSPRGRGRDTVVVSDTSGNADTATVIVTDTAVASISVTPASADVQVGATVQLTAVVHDSNGNALSGRTVSWTTSASSIATVSETGLVSGVSEGDATITATVEGKQSTAAVRVLRVPVASVAVSPPSASIEAGRTVQLSAAAQDAGGNTLGGREVTWRTSAADVATVSSDGLVMGVAPGSATISATVEGVSGASSITVTAPPPPPPPGSALVLVGAGDIARCGDSGAENTARILDTVPGTVFTTGDNAYPDGTAEDFANCYDPTWGRHKSRTRPSAGNHDYHTSGATGYFDYFGSAAGARGEGYYSYDLGDWHVVALNSNISMSAGSSQEQWLRADLAATTKRCVAAYWHHPRFSSGDHGNSSRSQAIWEALYDAGAEVVLAGHDHVYERFAPQTPNAVADTERGIREFVVGTGGKSLYGFGTPEPNSEVRYNSTDGVLKLTLRSDGYDWQFIPTSGSFSDTGSGTCH